MIGIQHHRPFLDKKWPEDVTTSISEAQANENANYVLPVLPSCSRVIIFITLRTDVQMRMFIQTAKIWRIGNQNIVQIEVGIFILENKGLRNGKMATFKNLKNHVLSKQNSSYMLFFLSSGNSNKQKSNRNGAGKKREWCPDWSRNVWHLWPVTDICEGLPRHSSTEKNTLENTPWRQELRLIREKLKSEVRVWLSIRKNYPVIKANLPGHGILCDAALTLSLKRSYSS